MNALTSLESAIRSLSLKSLRSWYERETWTELDDADLLPNRRPPTIYAIERMYALKTCNVEFLDHLVRGDWLLAWPGDEYQGATALHALVRIAGSHHKADNLFASIAEYLVNCEQLRALHAPDCLADDGRTPLHWASSISYWKASVPGLLALGADPNEQDHNGSTPLHYAASNWSLERVKQLVQHGSDRAIRNNDGHTPADKAKHSQDRTKRGKTDAQWIVDYLTSTLR